MNRKLMTGGGLAIALALFLGVNIIGNQTLTSWRLDVTENRLYTLAEGTRNILSRIEEPITIRCTTRHGSSPMCPSSCTTASACATCSTSTSPRVAAWCACW